MKHLFLLIGLSVFALTVPAQPPKSSVTKKAPPAGVKKPIAKTQPKKDERAELEKAIAIENAEQKAAALVKFLTDFPKTESRTQVLESLTAARVAASEAKFEAGDNLTAVKLARKAIEEAPVPYPEKLFVAAISKTPALLYFRGEAKAAHEVAAEIEKNSATSALQLVSLANFYLSTENGADAKRLSEAALKVDEKSAAGYLTLGMANRLNFDLEGSAAAYEKAVELDPASVSARQGLAEMKRALRRPDEAVAIFSALIEKDPSDVRSLNGRVLSLFDAGRRTEAEAEFAKAVEGDPANFILIAGAAYWYAARGENAKAIDLAGRAIAAEPRYIWSHIALARALSGDGRLADAEQVLLKARQYGNFPTLNYEIASVRYASGFYREAADELQTSFSVRDGMVVTKLGRRIERGEKNFIDLLADERRASILEPTAADVAENAEKMKALLEFSALISEKNVDEAKAADAAAAFASGSDKMRFHRQIFAANQLLDRSVAPAKALELSKAAVATVDDGLSIPVPAAPVMASELYASRTAAVAADKYVLVPEVQKQTISAIARGRIEEIAGWALMQQKNNAEAAIRFRRAVSILPEKSAWWRSSLWKLGTALEAEGKDKEALDAYVKSYTSADPDGAKFAAIEAVYKRLNTGTDGLGALIGANPGKPAEKAVETVIATRTATETKTDTLPETKTDAAGAEKKTDAAIEKRAEPIVEKAIFPAAASSPEIQVPREQEKEPKKEPAPPSPSAETESKKQVDENPVETKPTPVEEPPLKKTEAVQQEVEAKPSPIVDVSLKPAEVIEKPREEKTPETKPTPASLFEPVVIEVKKSTSDKTTSEREKPVSAPEKTVKTEDASGSSRPRVVVTDLIPCSLSISQENISLVAGSGSVGILVGAERGDVKAIKFASSSPKDVEVVAELENASVPEGALFVIRSLTTATGVYQVSFSSPCGKKEVHVRVR
jgi:tetratricopeptide (TPR) repeat protein